MYEQEELPGRLRTVEGVKGVVGNLTKTVFSAAGGKDSLIVTKLQNTKRIKSLISEVYACS